MSPLTKLEVRHCVREVDLAQDAPDPVVGVLVKGVEVAPQGAGEEERVLGDDGYAGPEGAQSDLEDIDAVDPDLTDGLGKTEEGRDEA